MWSAANYSWLAEASCVVVDEAHSSTTPEYTAILTWLGIRQTGRMTATRAPLIGLTATPFRGTSKEQTERLVGRFGRRRLDQVFGSADDPEATYRELQGMGVLAEVEGEELETGQSSTSPRTSRMKRRPPSTNSGGCPIAC